MESVILEANRLRSIDQNADTSLDEFNNRWTNSVSTTGIEVKAGDVVSIESAAINAKGNEVEDTMEFRGETEAGFKDNEVSLTYEYYVNHTGDYTIPLPFTDDLTYNGRAVTTSHADNYLAANAVNLLTRQLGEWSPTNVPIDPAADALIPTEPKSDYKTNPQFQIYFPEPIANQQKGGYTEGEVCIVYFEKTAGGTQETGVTIKVLTTRNEGQVTGFIDTWEIDNINMGTMTTGGWYYKITNPIQKAPQQVFYISNQAKPLTIADNSSIGVVFKNPKTFSSRSDMLPDGSRFYKGTSNFLGFGLNNCASIAEAAQTYPSVGTFTPRQTAGIVTDFSTLGDGNFTPYVGASTTTKFSVPTGFSTPTDVANTLTGQFHSPQIIDNNTNGSFVSTINYDYQNSLDENPIGLAPTMVETPSFKPITAGFDKDGQQPKITNIIDANGTLQSTYQDQYRIWYNSVYWKEPKRVQGLSFFRQLFYGLDNTDARNEINSGENQTPNCGDFANQTIGELGLLPRLLSKFGSLGVDATTNNPAYTIAFTNNQRYYPLRTNIKYTEAMCKKIGAAFKSCEENRNTHTQLPTTAGGVLPETPIGNPALFDTSQMAVLLDVGHFVDEKSQAGTLQNEDARIYQGGHTIGGTFTPPQFAGQEGFARTFESDQRNMFATAAEISAGATHTYVSTTKTSVATGDPEIPNQGRNCLYDARTFQFGDGQDLPQLWVQSRWKDGLQARNLTSARTGLLPNLNSSAVEDMMDFNETGVDMRYPNGFTEEDLADRFERSFTDSSGNTYTYEEYVKWAIDADVAILPYFPAQGDGTFLNEPYVAFYAFDIIGFTGVQQPSQFPNRAFVAELTLLQPTTKQQQFFGWDCSYTRNKAVFFQNTQQKNAATTEGYQAFSTGVNQTRQYEASPYGMIGAVDTLINFDAIKSRFEFKGLSTALTIGNPFLSHPVFGTKTATDNPEQQIYSVNRNGANYFIKSKGGLASTTPFVSTYGKFIIQANGSIIDSYSGISLTSITLHSSTDETSTTELTEYNLLNEFRFQNTLLQKMGFELAQLLPPFGDTQARFDDSLYTDPLQQPVSATTRITKPLTIGSFISSAEYQPTATDMNRFPLYGLGVAQNIQAEPQVQTASLVATNLPSKLDFPYLVVYTNLGSEMLYYGGSDAHSRLPCLAYISRNYSAGDFFYLPAGSFSLQVTRDFVLTDVTTDIRLPDGSRPRLSPHSSVIYKIQRAPRNPEAPSSPQTKSSEHNKKSLLNIN